MDVFHASKTFPKERPRADQVRRLSRSVCANIAEAWKRRCEAAFVAKLSDAEAKPPRRRCGSNLL